MTHFKFTLRENWSALRDALHHLWTDARFAPAQVAHSLRTGDTPGSHLLVDVYLTADEVVVRASLPGVKAEDIELTLSENQLTLTGTYGPSLRNVAYRVYERPTGRFARTLTLDTPVEATTAAATLHDGVLTVALPKKRPASSQPAHKIPL